MTLIKKLHPDFVFNDERGTLTQITHDKFEQTNAVFTRKNAVRGNLHYHKESNEYFYIISGKIKVTAQSGESTETAEFSTGDMFLIEKNIMHTFEYLDDSYLVVMYDKRIEKNDGTKDIFTK